MFQNLIFNKNKTKTDNCFACFCYCLLLTKIGLLSSVMIWNAWCVQNSKNGGHLCTFDLV